MGLAHNGEYVINKLSTKKLGNEILNNINLYPNNFVNNLYSREISASNIQNTIPIQIQINESNNPYITSKTIINTINLELHKYGVVDLCGLIKN